MAKLLQETMKTQLDISQYLEQEGVDVNHVRLFLNNKTLRLTKQGFALLHKHMGSWTVELERNFTTNELITMLRKVNAPYYIKKTEIILFSEEDAFMARLAGVTGWIDSK